MTRNLFLCLVGGSLLLQPDRSEAARPLEGPTPSLAWSACAASDFGDADVAVGALKAQLFAHLGDRLQCTNMPVPLDHYYPDGPKISVGLVRAKALDPAQRKGAYFFHIGGPGGNPRDFILSIGAKWATAEASDPIAGWQRTLSERYDLVAVIPRGLDGSYTFRCGSIDDIRMPPDAFNDWASTLDAAQSIAFDCAGNPATRWIGTEQHVFDLEQARRSLGDDVLNFVGYSYGGMVGAWHRAMFPARAGRMLLDSSIDFTASLDDADLATLRERDREFRRRALRPMLSKPERYGVTQGEEATMRTMVAMHPRAKHAWLPKIVSPVSLKAALTLAPVVAASPWITETDFRAALAGLRFSPDEAVDRKVRERAGTLINWFFGDDTQVVDAVDPVDTDGEAIHAPAWPTRLLPNRESVMLATRCNDNPWNPTPTYWRDVARQRAREYPVSQQGIEFFALVCSVWQGRVSTRPSLEPVQDTAPFLLIHAEYDVRTPLDGASRIVERFGNARMVVARGVSGHGIVAGSRTPCIEEAAGRFLLDGIIPAAIINGCPYVSRPKPPREPRADTTAPTDAGELIEAILGAS
ncbi:MAG TPA: alpha/beta fold hydrolase [Luteibacter sp.]|jgi:pimeloyl-ACP methyl ester carboxylesterase|uniref:alpha/beta hydrolase n=1 Tax=Luteibacter sp. TaxID=1886636 RepID=UPI002F40BFE5